jgi:PAS domain S-box-containing protein
VIDDLTKDKRALLTPGWRQFGFQCGVGLPLKVEGRVVGMAIANARLFSQVEAAGREWQQSFDSMSEGVSILSTDRRILRANLALARMLGTTPEALVGQRCYQVLHGLEGPVAQCPTVRCVTGGRTCDLTLQEPHLGNRWLQLCSDPVPNPEGKVLSVVHTVRDITDAKRAEESLRESTRKVRELAAAVVRAQDEERQWLALEMHDRIAQNLCSAYQQLEILGHMPPGKPEARQAAVNASTLLHEAICETRNVMDDLYPPGLNEFGLAHLMEEELVRFEEDTGCRTKLSVDYSVGLPWHMEVTLYRVFHEAFINVRKHAIGAKNVTVSLVCRDHVVRLIVEDDGPGFDVEAATQKKRIGGLTSMRRRTEIVSGSFEVTSGSGQGTRVTISAPVDDSNSRGNVGQ